MNEARVVGDIWWCGDYVCDCTQPQIHRVTNRVGHYEYERLWEGTFVNAYGDDSERAAQADELREAAARFNLVPHAERENYYVEAPAASPTDGHEGRPEHG